MNIQHHLATECDYRWAAYQKAVDHGASEEKQLKLLKEWGIRYIRLQYLTEQKKPLQTNEYLDRVLDQLQ